MSDFHTNTPGGESTTSTDNTHQNQQQPAAGFLSFSNGLQYSLNGFTFDVTYLMAIGSFTDKPATQSVYDYMPLLVSHLNACYEKEV